MYFKKSKFEQIQGTGQEDLWGREFKTAFPNQWDMERQQLCCGSGERAAERTAGKYPASMYKLEQERGKYQLVTQCKRVSNILTWKQLFSLVFIETINCDITISYINLNCERAADLKDRKNERPLRKPKPQKCLKIAMKSMSNCFAKYRRFICIQ